MKSWDALARIRIKDKERFQNLFSAIVNDVKNGMIITVGEVDKGDYYIVTEDNRAGGYFIHIVPKEAYTLFKEMQKMDGFLGFSVVASKFNGKYVRVSCFGVECNLLGKSLR